MALSGSANGGAGYVGSYLRVEWSATQNAATNQSTITTNLYVQLGNTYYVATEDGNTNVDGQQFNFSNGTVTTSYYQKRLLQTTTKTVNHNADGTKTFTESAYFLCGWATFGSLSLGTTTFTLDTIPRYATINSFTSSAVTDVGFTLNVTVDATCDQIQYSIDNGSNYTTVVGDFTTKAIVIGGNLASNTTFPCKVIVRRKDSQLTTTSSVLNVTTNAQSNFFAWSTI